MRIEITMPKLSDTMEDGKILRWLKKPGETVAVGEVLAEVETDKADMELEAVSEGVLAEIVVKEGASAAVGDVIALLGDGEETKAPPEPIPAAPEEKKVALASRPESGSTGQIAKRDVEPPRSPAAPPVVSQPARREELSKIRRTVAHRMVESKREAPHFYLTAEIDMGDCARLKESLGTARPEGPAVSYTHLLLRAVALALRDHPRLNARYVHEDAIEFLDGIHLGIATALDEGLIVPVLHDCGSKDVFEIALEARALVERVRAGKAQGTDLSGGTFTVSNLGMFPVEEFAAVINPPQAAVLAAGAVRERAVVKKGVVVPAMTMRVTISCDHRVVDGAEAARFLATLKTLLENPARLLIS